METSIVVGVIALVVGLVLGRVWGKSSGVEQGKSEGLEQGREQGVETGRVEAKAEAEREMRALVDAVARGRRPEGLPEGSAAAELQRALEAGWAPKEQERQSALREAIGRVGGFLDKAVRTPLAEATAQAESGELFERIQRALGSLQDLEFFRAEPTLKGEGTDLPKLVQQVTREFAQDQTVGIRISMDGRPVRAKVNTTAFMDALYLILHNAARFGGGATVDVTVVTEDDSATVRVRDRGPGFSEEAFQRAFDPFYSTTEDGLGLGLPQARRVIEGMGGTIGLRNMPDGGGEVEISFPKA